MLERVDGNAILAWAQASAASLTERRAELDALNVFPIPDGDTGSNLAATASGAAASLALQPSAAAGDALARLSRAAVLCARGNSGVILSQVLRGMADHAHGFDSLDGAGLASALSCSLDRARASVATPVEGTILSVLAAAESGAAAAAAPGGSSASSPASLDAVLTSACEAARSALSRTTDQLAQLRSHGVVDAGGAGLVVVLTCLQDVVRGTTTARHAGQADLAPGLREPRPREPWLAISGVRESGLNESESGMHAFATAEAGAHGYEVQYLLELADPDAQVEGLRSRLTALGDSVVVAGSGDGTYAVHAHVSVAGLGPAIEAGGEYGRLRRIEVVRFADTAFAVHAVPPATSGIEAVLEADPVLVAVAPGDGLADLFRAEGVVVVDGGPAESPSIEQVLHAVRGAGSRPVVLMPNSAAVNAVAERAAQRARDEGMRVALVPTKSPVQGLAAVAVHDGGRRFEDDVIAMAEAAAATRFAEVTVAVGESITYAGRCDAGDVLGLIDGEVVEIGSDLGMVAISLARRLINAGGELVTVLVGSDPTGPAAAAKLGRYLRTRHPLVDYNEFIGDQPVYPLLIGVE